MMRLIALAQRVALIAGTVVAGMAVTAATAADDTIRIVVPATAGGSIDALARLLAPGLKRELKNTVVVENRPGAGGNIGIESVVTAQPDGKTVLMAATALAVNVSLYKLNFDPTKDLKPVIQLTSTEYFLVVHKKLGVKTVNELRQLARRSERGLSCAAGPGSMTMACEMLRIKLEGRSVTVPYPGVAPALTALLGGHVDVAILDRAALGPAMGHPDVRILASLGSAIPSPPFEKLPLLKNTWPDWFSNGFYGIFVPAATPPELLKRLNQAFNKVLAQPNVIEFIAQDGDHLVGGPPERMATELAEKIVYYKKLSKLTGAIN